MGMAVSVFGTVVMIALALCTRLQCMYEFVLSFGSCLHVLSTGNVIAALTDRRGERPHIPYRDSK